MTQTVGEFRNKLRTYLSTYFRPGAEIPVQRKDHAECIFPLSYQQLAEDMTDEFVTCLHYHILYAKKNSNDSEYHVALYSLPYEHDMVVVIMDSIQHGLIESVKVLFFDSLDIMYAYVRQMWIDSLFQKGKAQSPMLVTELGMMMEVRPLQKGYLQIVLYQWFAL